MSAQACHSRRSIPLAFLLGLLALLPPWPCADAQSPAAPDREVFRIGFSTSLFSDVNENDARAGVKAWAQTIARERGIAVDPDPAILAGLPALRAALVNGQVDMVSILAEEYRALRGEMPLAPLFVAFVNGRIEEEALLLVHGDSGIERLEDLQGRRLLVHRNPRASLALPWLESLLLEKGLPPAAAFLGSVTENPKLSGVILPVFFRKTDVALATRGGFDTLKELNPQIGQSLRVLATAPKMVPVLMAFRADYNPAFKGEILNGLRELHQSPAGQQVLNIFHSDRLEDAPAEALQSALDLLARVETLQAGGGAP